MIVQHLVDSRQSAHAAATALYGAAKRGTEKGRSFLMQLISSEPERRHQLRKMFHGPVLKDISEQVWVFDPVTSRRVRYAPAAWKILFAQMFIAPTFEEVVVRGKKVVRERHRSTEELTDDEFSIFLLQVQAFAVCELGVEFAEEGAQP